MADWNLHPKQVEFFEATPQRIHIPYVGPVVVAWHSRPHSDVFVLDDSALIEADRERLIDERTGQ